jgi:hypothetical protein
MPMPRHAERAQVLRLEHGRAGITLNLRSRRRIIDFRLYVPDLPGFGDSGKPTKGTQSA